MTTKCTGLWLPAKFGKSPHPECYGCVRKIAFKDPLSANVKPPPQFVGACPLKETK